MEINIHNFDLSTGIPGLDTILKGVLAGDNIVFQVDSLDDFLPFVHKFCLYANQTHKKLIYFRFAEHQSLIPPEIQAEILQLDPIKGFEGFISKILNVIEKHGEGACYVFDLLSDLAVDWYSDVMVGNFFMLTCPFLFKWNTATLFAIIRNHHDALVIEDIQNTAQIILDVYRNNQDFYLQPVKVWNRHSPTMYMLHKWQETSDHKDIFVPVMNSATITEIYSKIPQPWLDFTSKRSDIWSLSFQKAQEIITQSINRGKNLQELEENKNRLIKMVITRDPKRLELAERYFTLDDLLKVGKRMIGTGLIGGKSVGMLLARAILNRENEKIANQLEMHDSFFIGSDVFYTFLVKNGCWWLRERITNPKTFLEGIEATKKKFLEGIFPKNIIEQFSEMLKYFGQSPIIVRSSSLLEDDYGNAFSGKYESIFLVNQGPPEERLTQFINAVRTIYASTINVDALNYRKDRHLLEHDEQMALLVQRVSGGIYGTKFFPLLAGVGFSFNPYVWNRKIDPKSGFLRLVFGLGTRAVERTEDDYTRLVALNIPSLRPEPNLEDIQKFSQKKVDLLDLQKNEFHTMKFTDLNLTQYKLDLSLFCTFDEKLEQRMIQANYAPEKIFPWYLTFDKILKESQFANDMKLILDVLQKAYNHPMDIEFTANFESVNKYCINLLQCRPFQVRLENPKIAEPENISLNNIILQSNGPIIGTSIAMEIDRIIYIVPALYGKLAIRDRYSIARLIGKIAHAPSSVGKRIMLIGPGRWGTTTPSLGIPTTFSEINTIQIIGEIAEMHEGLIPDVSLGTHFFNDLVELNMLYFALHPDKQKDALNQDLLNQKPNELLNIEPNSKAWENIILVVDSQNINPNSDFKCIINFNSLSQKGVAWIEKKL
jgi:hypothetical protein